MIAIGLRRLIEWLRGSQEEVRLGVYGPVNSGKTTLANRMSTDFGGPPVGPVSPIPHETRSLQIVERVEMRVGRGRLTVTIVDTPGIATRISYRTFLRYGLSKSEALVRAAEAARGVIEAIKSLDSIDVALMVLDSTRDPLMQANLVLLGNLEAREIPYIIVANKIDLPRADPRRVRAAYPRVKIVPISALKGINMGLLYRSIYEAVRRRGATS
ncbi:MAG: GTP-binding protein [Thermoproteota archaeon]|nr:MAG: GTP-binding protein [Candidatus Korarchaeota archaeon]